MTPGASRKVVLMCTTLSILSVQHNTELVSVAGFQCIQENRSHKHHHFSLQTTITHLQTISDSIFLKCYVCNADYNGKKYVYILQFLGFTYQEKIRTSSPGFLNSMITSSHEQQHIK